MIRWVINVLYYVEILDLLLNCCDNFDINYVNNDHETLLLYCSKNEAIKPFRRSLTITTGKNVLIYLIQRRRFQEIDALI